MVVSSNTDIVLCTENTTNNPVEINGFGLRIIKHIFPRPKAFYLHKFSTIWLLFNPCEQLKMSNNDTIPLNNHQVTLAFGSLISPYHFKCAESKFLFKTNSRSMCKLFFAKNNSRVDIIIGYTRFSLKREHIDNHRGVIVEVKSIYNIIVHICLLSNLDEYTWKNGMSSVIKINAEDLLFFLLSILEKKHVFFYRSNTPSVLFAKHTRKRMATDLFSHAFIN